MHQLMGITLLLLTVCGDEDLPSVSMETLTNDVTSVPVNDSTTEDLHLAWLKEAVLDVAYYLRSHKFNEYDRRYHKEAIVGDYFGTFPRPPLRSLHWEVQLHCETSFVHCMEYLHKRVKLTDLHRKDDTSVVIMEQKWNDKANADQIKSVDSECKAMKEKDDKLANPFEGPLERFKWRTTASYFMCWYAMNGVPTLEKFEAHCDNFANCLDKTYGAANADIRARDSKAFACALYSLCPDPCCPIRHISKHDECWNSELNPCFLHNSNEQRSCLLERGRNTDFTDIVLNRWNITCKCANAGYVWESKFGTCVDVNECAIGNHTCNEVSELCVNMPGSYRCVCNWGYMWNEELARCVESGAVKIIKGKFKDESADTGPFKLSFRTLFKKLFSSSSANFINSNIMVIFVTFLGINLLE